MKNSSLSVNSVGRQTAKSRPAVGRRTANGQLVNCRPTVGRCWPSLQLATELSADERSTVGQLSADSFLRMN